MSDPFAPPAQQQPDPWAVTDPSTPAPQEAPPVTPSETRDRFSIKLTLKANGGFDAEWINPWVSGATADECAVNTVAMLNALANHGVIDMVANAAQYTRGQYKGGGAPSGGGSAPRQQQRPAAPSTPPGVTPKSCQHGPMVFRTGENKWGKPYQAFFCPTDKDDPNKCKPIFLD